MAPTLYHTGASPPSQFVLLTARALNIDLELKNVDFFKDEHLSPEYAKLNPEHTVPTLVEGDFVLWESRAIARYLAGGGAGGSSLYPPEARLRARVDQRLDFDLGTLSRRYEDYYYPQFYDATKKPQEADLAKLREALGLLDGFLAGSEYVAGDRMTIADLSIVATVAAIHGSHIHLKGFTNILRWFELMKSTAPGYQEAVQKHVDTYDALKEQWMNKFA